MSGKDKLISVEHLKWNVGGIKCGTLTVDYLNWILDHEEPAVDAEPVRHGKWRFVKCATGLRSQCSECLHWVDAGTDRNYCPECGARMDGDERD